MNNVQILGTITKEPELKYSANGSAILNLYIAYNDKYKAQSGEIVEKAHFFNVVVFGKQAETINSYFHKGSRILVDGSLDFQSWEKDGQKRSTVNIKLKNFTFVDRKSDNEQPQQNQGYQQQPQTVYQNNQGQQVSQNQYQQNMQQQMPPQPQGIDLDQEVLF